MRLVKFDGHRWHKVVELPAPGILSPLPKVSLPSSAASLLEFNISLLTKQPHNDHGSTYLMKSMHSNFQQSELMIDPISNYDQAPFCCDQVACIATSKGKDPHAKTLITDLVNVMRYDPYSSFTHDSYWNPNISVRDITSVLHTNYQYKNIISIEKTISPPRAPGRRTRAATVKAKSELELEATKIVSERFFVPTWNTPSSYRGAYLEVELKNGNWSTNSIIRAAIEPYYNTKRKVFKTYTCPIHKEVSYRCVVWDVTQEAVPGLRWLEKDGNGSVFPSGYQWPVGTSWDDVTLACRFGVTVETWWVWKEMNESEDVEVCANEACG